MFNFFKNLFKKKYEKKEIKADKLKSWFDNKTIRRFEKTNQEFEEKLDDIRDLLNKLDNHLEKLRKADIKNPDKVQDKIKQVVLGHRKSYCRTLSNFVDNILFPDKITYVAANEFSNHIDERLTELGKKTIKSYKAVQHLFFDELKPIKDDLKNLAKLADEIKEIIKNNEVMEIEEIKEDIDEFISSIERKANIKSKLIEQKKRLSNFENEKQTLENNIEELRKSDDYIKLKKYNKKIEDIDKSIKQKENQFLQLFSSVEKGLRMFERISINNKELVGKYLDSCVDTFFNDEDLKIINILKNLKRNVLSGTIDLRERKKKKLLEGIEAMSSEKLKQIISEHKKLIERKEKIKDNMSLISVKSEIKELKSKIKQISSKIKNIKEDINSFQRKYNKIDISTIRQELEDDIKERIKVDVSISL